MSQAPIARTVSTENKAGNSENRFIKNFINQTGYYIALGLTVAFVLFPIFWIAITAFKQSIDVQSASLFFTPTLQNFRTIFSHPFNFAPLIYNSMVVGVLTVLIAIPLAVMCAYAISRYTFIGQDFLLIAILATQFLPPVVVILPYFIQFRNLGLLDSYTGLVIVNLSRVLPFTIWLLKGFIDTLPTEIEEAAYIDGCNELGVLRHVTFPLIMPGIATSTIFAFIMAWNEFLFALILSSTKTKTVIIGLVSVVGEQGVVWELMSAAGLIVMVPMIILAFSIRKYFVEGMTMGAVK